jgi:magnesium chelatase subunit I
MPYSWLVGQGQLKRGLELAFIAPRIGGVLLSGERGTGKSTVVRAFGVMVHERLPVTLPINATEDRVVGGWDIDQLLLGKTVWQAGLLEEAHEGILFIDEVNLLDDHIVNIILDAISSGVLAAEREGESRTIRIQVSMVGTMNPAEGGLRPQLLDRFGLMVAVETERSPKTRVDILEAVLAYDAALALERDGREGPELDTLRAKRAKDQRRRGELLAARDRLRTVDLTRTMAERCVSVASLVQVEGHRGDYIMGLAARANAALRGSGEVTAQDLIEVAPLALQHRRAGSFQGDGPLWPGELSRRVAELVQADPRGGADESPTGDPSQAEEAHGR